MTRGSSTDHALYAETSNRPRVFHSDCCALRNYKIISCVRFLRETYHVKIMMTCMRVFLRQSPLKIFSSFLILFDANFVSYIYYNLYRHDITYYIQTRIRDIKTINVELMSRTHNIFFFLPKTTII